MTDVDLGLPELAIVLLILMLVFGANRVPTLARSLGEAIHEFRRGQHEPTVTPTSSPAEPADSLEPESGQTVED